MSTSTIKSMSRSTSRRTNRLHANYLVTAIDINDLAGGGCGSIAGEENSRGAQLGRIATAFQWCAFLIMFKHRAEPADAPGGERLHRPRRNAVYPDFFWTKIVGKITRTGFEARLGHAHHIVVRHDLLRAVIGHRNDAASIGHHRRRVARKRY